MEDFKDIIKNINESDFLNSVDLHIHSTYSDGKMTPQEIINKAKEKNLKFYSICDHNTVEAYLNTNIASIPQVIPAVEFDCWYKGILLHIIGYGINYLDKDLKKLYSKDKAGTDADIIRFFTYRDPKKVIKAIHNAGGIAVLAHPACCWAISLDNLVKNLKNIGLDGLEVFYPYKRHRGIIKFHTIESVKKIAQKYNMIKTGGSDTHDHNL